MTTLLGLLVYDNQSTPFTSNFRKFQTRKSFQLSRANKEDGIHLMDALSFKIHILSYTVENLEL